MYTTLTCTTILIILIAIVGCIVFITRHNRKDTLVNRFSPIILLHLIIVSLCCSPCLATMLINDIYLWQFQRNFQQISHPPSSILLISASDVGLLAGNSNHCDFYVGEMRWDNQLSAEQIENFYQNMTIPAAKKEVSPYHETRDFAYIRTIFIENEQTFDELLYDSLPESLDSASDWGVDISKYQKGTLYIVHTINIGYDPGFDIRCH